MRTIRFTLCAVALALFVLSCTSGLMVLDGSGDLVGESRGIYNGAPPDAAHHDSVVSLHGLTRKGDSVYVSPFCTGTLITDTVVLTAAHCLDDANGGNNFRTMDPSGLAIYVGDEPAVDIVDHLYLVTETLIHPSYDRNALRDDIALVRLATAVTEAAPVGNLPAAEGFSAADAGLVLNFAGFGQDENGNSGVKLQGDWPITGLGCVEPECPDAGDDATQISYDQIDGGPCFGDSGGPAFVDRAGTWYVGGITSYGDSYCAYYGVSTRADAYEAWIGAFTGATPPPDCSVDGWCNPECAEGDDPDCALPPDDCGDGVCGMGESCDGRDGTTECSADCDGRTNGKPSSRYCYVEGVCEGAGCP